jgi:hypothetical protein
MQGQSQAPAGSAQEQKKSPRTVGPGQSEQRPSPQAQGGAQSDQKSDAMKSDEMQGQKKSTQSQDDTSSKTGRDAKQTQQPDSKAQQTTQRPKDEKSRDRAGTGERSKERGAEQRRDQGMSGQERGQAKTQQPGRTGTQTDAQTRSGDGAKLSERQQTSIQQTFERERNLNVVSRTNINVSVSVGATIPRSVRLAPLPASIVAVVPQYRGFHYVVVEEEIVIVHPRTQRVVEVIPMQGRGSARVATTARPSSQRVQLSSDQRTRILSYAASDCTTVLAQPDFDLAVGVAIPQQIELCPFEGPVVTEVSVVRPYRFFRVQDQVVLVDPRDHTIVEVIR